MNIENLTFKIIEYEDKNLPLIHKKYIKILAFYQNKCVLIFNFPPFLYQDENQRLEGTYLSIKSKIGNIIKNDLEYRITYHESETNKEKKNNIFQLKIKNFNLLLKKIIGIFIGYYEKTDKKYPETLFIKRTTGNKAKKNLDNLYYYNLNIYKTRYNVKIIKDTKLKNKYKENLLSTIINF